MENLNSKFEIESFAGCELTAEEFLRLHSESKELSDEFEIIPPVLGNRDFGKLFINHKVRIPAAVKS